MPNLILATKEETANGVSNAKAATPRGVFAALKRHVNDFIGKSVLDEDDMASDSDAAVPTQQSVKAYALTGPATSSDTSLAFDTWRTPNADRPTQIVAHTIANTDGTAPGRIIMDVDESGGVTADYSMNNLADTDAGTNVAIHSVMTVIIPAGGAYQIRNDSDPRDLNTISTLREFAL